MKVRMRKELWDSFGLDRADSYNLALCCFYLGKGLEETRDLLERRPDDPEVLYTIETAVYSGLNPDVDSIVKTYD